MIAKSPDCCLACLFRPTDHLSPMAAVVAYKVGSRMLVLCSEEGFHYDTRRSVLPLHLAVEVRQYSYEYVSTALLL